MLHVRVLHEDALGETIGLAGLPHRVLVGWRRCDRHRLWLRGLRWANLYLLLGSDGLPDDYLLLLFLLALGRFPEQALNLLEVVLLLSGDVWLLGLGGTQSFNMLPQLIHLAFAHECRLCLLSELVCLRFQCLIELGQLSREQIDPRCVGLFPLLCLLKLLLQIQDNHGRPDDVVIDHDSVLLALQFLPEIFNRFVLLSYQVVLALVPQFALPEGINQGLVDILFPVLEDYAHLSAQ